VAQTPGVNYERLFLEHLSTIERVARNTARRRRLPASEHEDFVSLVRLKLIDDNYRVLRDFKGQSSLRTYLTTVIVRQLLDYQNARWGRWRPSARARMLGQTAARLEQLTHRDGHSLEEANQILRVNDRVPESEAELYALSSQLSRPPSTTEADIETALQVPSPAPSVDALIALRRDEETVLAIVTSSLKGMPTRDRLLLSLHFGRGVPVADVAKALGLSKATAYRTIKRALRHCRGALQAAGFDERRVRDVSPRGSGELPGLLDALLETPDFPGRLTD